MILVIMDWLTNLISTAGQALRCPPVIGWYEDSYIDAWIRKDLNPLR